MEPYTQLLRTSRQLRAVGYTAAFIMRPDHWWGAFLAHAAGIRERVGYALPDVAPFLTTAVPVYNGHAIRQSMRLVEKWTGTLTDEQIHFHLPVDEGDRLSMGEWSQAVDIRADKAIVCIHPGAGTWAKQWEIGRWAQVADALADHYDAQVILTGGSAEASLAEQILSQSQRTHVNAAGALSLGQLAALFQRARLVIGNDSGPMHIAAAVQTPTLTLFGPANPAEFAPWGDRQKHLLLMSNIGCRPCRVLDWGDDPPVNHPCLRDITVPDVLAAAGRLLNA